MKEADRIFKTGDYRAALNLYRAALKDHPVGETYYTIQWKMARSHEQLSEWKEALALYRAVSQGALESFPRLAGLAQYGQSRIHEALGEFDAALASLKDAESRIEHLPTEIANAELPARMGAMYARHGHFKDADRYFKQAEIGLKALKNQASRDPEAADRYASTLHSMGVTPMPEFLWAQFPQAIRPLMQSQTYLLELTELGLEPWAAQAAEHLLSSYDRIWRAIRAVPLEETDDVVLAQRRRQDIQQEMALMTLESLKLLKLSELPEPSQASPLPKVRKALSDLELKLVKLIHQPRVGDELTAESRARQRPVQVINPDPLLENLRKARLQIQERR